MDEQPLVWPVADLEYRQRDRHLSGSFPYGPTATVMDRGRVRKERISPGAFRFAIEAPEREISLLSGHSLDRPLASKLSRTLRLVDGDDALRFEATLPPEGDQPSWMVDTVKAVRAKLVRGISPGFRIPPLSVVPNAEEDVPEPGNPGVFIRLVRQAVLGEISLVTRPAYPNTTVDLRAAFPPTERRGVNLVRVLESAIPEGDRTATIERMGAAAGITASTVNQILRNEIDHPPIDRLRGFARSLGLSLARLVEAVVEDGANPDTYREQRAADDSRFYRWL